MAEELLVKCRKCGLVYDKLRNRGCPKCEPRVRPGTAAPAQPATAGEPGKSSAAGASGSTAAPPKATLSVTLPRLPRTAAALVLGLTLGFGAARWLAARATHGPVLLPLPAPAPASRSTAATTPATAPDPAASTAPQVGAPGPVGPSVVAGADGKAPVHPIELLDARRGAPRADGTLEYTVVLVNRTTNTVKEMRVRGVGEDRKGNRVVTEEVAVEPGLVGGAREATAHIVVPDGTVLHEYSVTAWVEHGAMVRMETPAEPPRGGKLRTFPPSTTPEPGDLEPQPDAGAEAPAPTEQSAG